jgi:hypothetical protein
MDSIVLSIYSSIEKIEDKPIVIYMGIGTFAGLTNENGKYILEDKNYHQFPPCIQKLYIDNKDMELFIILVDPLLENPIYMTTDNNLKNKYFNSDWIYSDVICDKYINNRITIYPFRQSVKTIINEHTYKDNENVIDITNNIYQIHDICINYGITFIYHDFTGQYTSKNIEKYFYNQIGSYSEQFIYGLGGGYISECYYDFTNRETFFATTIEYKQRKIIKIFNIEKILNDYNPDNLNNANLQKYITDVIEKYGYEYTDIIHLQIQKMKEELIYQFKNYIIYILRIIKEFNDSIINNIEFDKIKNIEYYLSKIDINGYIKNLIEIKDTNIFNKLIQYISNDYKNKIKLILLNTQYNKYEPYEILSIVTSNIDKYKWLDEFSRIFN